MTPNDLIETRAGHPTMRMRFPCDADTTRRLRVVIGSSEKLSLAKESVEMAEENQINTEAAQSELEKIFPNKRVSVQEKRGIVRDPVDGSTFRFHYYRIFVGGRNWRKPTLRECMAQVREWKDSL